LVVGWVFGERRGGVMGVDGGVERYKDWTGLDGGDER